MIVNWSEAWSHNDSLLKIIHGLFLFWTPHELFVLLHQDDQWSGAFHNILDPDPDNATYTQETMDISERGAIWPIQYLLNLLILRVMTPLGTFVTNGNHLRNAKAHLPLGECPSSLFELLEDLINIVNMITDEMSDSRIFHSDLIKQAIQS